MTEREGAPHHDHEDVISVLIADDETMIRAGLRLLLEAEDDLTVVGEACDGIEAVEMAAALAPDVVLMDIRMPKLDGLMAARRLLSEAGYCSRVIMLTTFDEDENVFEALRLGASGFMLKAAPPERLLEAIRTAVIGNALIDPAVTKKVIEAFAQGSVPRKAPPELEKLTPRELEVLELLTTGLANAEIARTLSVSEATVKTHVNRILTKLGLRDRSQAVIFAYEFGVVRPGSVHARDLRSTR